MKKRTSWQIQCAVVNALYLREMKTRFGSKKMGYFWAIIEPASVILFLWALFGLHMRGQGKDVDYPIFLLTGMMPFHFFSNLSNSFTNAFNANQSLFNYKQVKPIDTLFSRTLVETLVQTLVFLFLLTVAGLFDLQHKPNNPLLFILLYLELTAFSFGFGLVTAVISQFSETFQRIMNLLKRPLFFLSGIFFSVESLPEPMRAPMLINPILNFLELIRAAFFSNFYTPLASNKYIFLWTISLNVIGLWLYSKLEKKIIAS